MTVKAIIFDFDGVITDTEPVHMDAWLEVLEPMGITFDEDEFRDNYMGLNDRDFLDEVGRIHGQHFEPNEKIDLIERKTAVSIEILEQEIPLIPRVKEFVESESQKVMLSICSGAIRGEIEFILKRLGWEKYFSPIIASDSVEKGKPDPEGYIRAYEGLVERAETALLIDEVIAIEDSPKGITAAKAAGLKCIGVKHASGKSDISHADIVVNSVSEIDLQKL